MGLMDKIRDIFTEEVDEEIEEPIKKEVIQVEIPAPLSKDESEESVKPAPKKEEKTAPIFFDDNDFASLEPPKKTPKVIKPISVSKPKVEPKKEEKKMFKPTPIISPVYGVLDKNYHKEDIKTKNSTSINAYYNHKDVSIDDIRKKAYGTLEDELEITLFGEPESIEVEPTKPKDDFDMFDELLEDKETKEDTDGSELFNLIDSMYEKGDADNGNS